MKHFCFTLLAFTFFVTTATAQDLIWAKQVAGSLYEQVVGLAICHDAGGNVYSTGVFSGTTDFDPGPGVANLTSAGNNDIFITKFDAQGNFQWVKQIGAADYDDGRAIKIDAVGNIIITGLFTGTVDFDPGAGTANLTSVGNNNTYVCKLSNTGSYVWARAVTGSVTNTDMSLDISGNVIFTGSFSGTVDFDPGVGTANLAAANTAAFICKLTSAGNFTWARQLGGCSNCAVRSYRIAVDSANNVLTTGHLSGSNIDFDPGAASFTLSAPGYSPFVSKLDSNGIFVWAKSFDLSPDAYGFGIGVGPNGDVYTTGYFKGTIDTDPGAATNNFTSAGDQDIYVVKLNASGSLVWAKQLGGRLFEQPTGLATDALDNIYVTAVSDDSVNLNYAPILLIKLNNSGNAIWSTKLNGRMYHSLSEPDVDNSGNMYVTGSLRDTTDFDPGNGSLLFTTLNVSTTDAFFVKLGNCPSTIATGNVSTTLCAGAAVNVNYTAGCNFNAGNVFTAQLSDASGSFASPVTIGSRTDTASGVITATLPLGTANGTGYRIRVVSSNPVVIGSDNGSNITIGGAGCACNEQNVQWAKNFGGTDWDEAHRITHDASGNIYTTGIFTGTATFGAITLTSAGGRDVFALKTDAAGNVVWAKRFGGTADDEAFGIAVNDSGNVYITGRYNNTADFGSFSKTSLGYTDIFVLKLDATGNVLWVQSMGGAFPDGGTYILTDAAGNAYVTGFFYGNATFGSFNPTPAANFDIYVAKLNAAGTVVWVKSYGGIDNDAGIALDRDNNGNIYLTGYFGETVAFGSSTLSSVGQFQEIFLTKLNNLGDAQWAVQFGGPGLDYGQGVSVGTDGSIYLTGHFGHQAGTADWATFGPFTLHSYSAGTMDMFVLKTNNSGVVQWANGYGGIGDDDGYDIVTDSSNNVYVAGYFYAASFGPYTLTGRGAVVVKLNTSGAVQWANSLEGDPGGVYGRSITRDNAGNIYAAGSFGTATATIDNITLTNHGINRDIFILKFGNPSTITTSAVSAQLCPATTINVPFTFSCTANNGNVFTAQLSDASGSFASPVNIGTLTGTGSGTISATIPTGTANGTGYRIRVVSSNPAVTGSDNGSNIAIGGAGCVICTSDTFGWAFPLGVGGVRSTADATTLDKDFNIISCGVYSSGTIDFDPGPGIVNLPVGGGYVIKTGPAKNLIWARRVGDGNAVYPFVITSDNAGAIYVTGNFDGTVDFDPGVGVSSLTSIGHEDCFVLKLDPNGNFLWVKGAGSTERVLPLKIVVDIHNNVIIGGYFKNTVDFDPGAGTFNLTGNGLINSFVWKLNSQGNFVWVKSFVGNTTDVTDVATDNNGFIYTTGAYSGGAIDLDPNAGAFNLSGGDRYLSKLDSAGNFVWGKGTGGDEIELDGQGNILLYGSFYNTVDFDPGAGSFPLTSAGNGDFYILKLDTAANFTWVKRIGGTLDEHSGGMDVDALGDIYLGGKLRSTVDVDPGAAVNNLTALGDGDGFVLKLNSQGDFKWVAQFASTADPNFYSSTESIVVDNNLNVYTSGSFVGTVDFNYESGTQIHTTGPPVIGFVVKIEQVNSVSASISPASPVICNGESVTLTASGASSYAWSNGLGSGASKTVSPTVSTTYIVTATDASNCNAVATGTVTVNQPTTGSINAAICQGQAYFFNGVNRTTAGAYLDTLVNAAGCDSILTLNLTVKQTTAGSFSASICQGESYLFNGIARTATGAYLDTLVNAAGCDSILTLNLTVNQLPAAAINGPTTLCSGLSATLTANGGVSYTWANSLGSNAQITVSPVSTSTYTVTVTDANTCSATASQTVSVTTTPVAGITGPSQICNGETATLTANGGNTYQWANGLGTNAQINAAPTSGTTTYTVTATIGANCSATASHTLTVYQPAASQFSHTICSGSSYTYNGIAQTTAGAYLDTLQTINGCDSVVTLNLTVNQPTTGSISASICQGESYLFNGIARTATGAYLDTLVNAVGCDSILTLNLTVKQTSTGTITASICQGESYLFNGIARTTAGAYLDTLVNAAGCDSILTLNLTVNDLPAATINGPTTICSGLSATLTATGGTGYSWDNGLGTNTQVTVTPTNTTTYTVTVTDGNNCSATATQSVSVTSTPTASITGPTQICDGESATLTANGGNTYQWANGLGTNSAITVSPTGTTTYTVTATIGANCSATASHTITVYQPAASQFSQTICSGQSYTYNGIAQTTSGAYLDTLQTVNGCDSVVTLNLTVSPVLTGSFSQNICAGSSYTFNGVALTQAGTYADIIQNGNGCDSIVTLNLTISNVLTGSFSQAICPGSSYSFNGLQLTQAGTYADTLQTSGGCDSIVTLNLTILPLLQGDTVMNVCEGTVYEFNGQLISEPGNYNDTIPGSNGCDSIVTLHYQITDIDDSVSVTGAVCTVQQNNAGYQWIDCNADTAITGADQKTFTATQNGSYQCIIFKGPCTDTTACVSVTTIGIAEIDNMHVSLYPNPNTGIFTLEFSDNVTREIEVTDAIGKLVLAGYKVEGKQSVNLGTPAAGVYFLRIKQAGKTKTMRFTVAW